MSEWWTYSPSDFLLFSARTYYRLLEIHNAESWPAHALTLAVGLVILVLVHRDAAWRGRAISGAMAALWAWVAWSFLWNRYSTINWAARYAALVFGIEALLLVWQGVVRGRLDFRVDASRRSVVAMALFATSLTYPLLLTLFGRDWREVEVFGITADPTVVATLGLLLVPARRRWSTLIIPMLWCALSAGTLWLLDAPESWLLIAVLLVTIIGLSLKSPDLGNQQQPLRDHAAAQ